jgi:hypothetical protein
MDPTDREMQHDFYYKYFIQHGFNCRPSGTIVSEDTEIETRAVAPTAFTLKWSNYSTRSHPQRY